MLCITQRTAHVRVHTRRKITFACAQRRHTSRAACRLSCSWPEPATPGHENQITTLFDLHIKCMCAHMHAIRSLIRGTLRTNFSEFMSSEPHPRGGILFVYFVCPFRIYTHTTDGYIHQTHAREVYDKRTRINKHERTIYTRRSYIHASTHMKQTDEHIQDIYEHTYILFLSQDDRILSKRTGQPDPECARGGQEGGTKIFSTARQNQSQTSERIPREETA